MFGINVGRIIGYLTLNTKGWDKKNRSIKADLKVLGREMMYLGTAITGVMAGTVREFGTFDKAIREATAVTAGLTTGEFLQMREMAEEMSIALNKAATETATGFYYLGSAGLSATEQMQSYNTVVSLARALTVDVGEAAEGLVDIMRAFNIEFSRSAEVGNTLTAAITTSNQVFGDLDKALSYVSATASLAGNTLEETSAVLGIMANAGIKGSLAGTVFRRAIINMLAPSSAMRDLLHELGVAVFDMTGKSRKFADVFGDVSEAIKGTSDEYRGMVFRVLFGVRAIGGMIKVFDAGREGLRDYTNQLYDMKTALDDVTKWQMKAFLHQMGQVWRRVQKLARTIGETLVPTLQDLGKWMDRRAVQFENWIEQNKELTASVIKWTTAIGASLIPLGLLLIVLPNIVTSIGLLYAAFTGLIVPILLAVAGFYAIRAAWDISWKDMEGTVNNFAKEFKGFLGLLGINWESTTNFLTRAFRTFVDSVWDGWVRIGLILHGLGQIVKKDLGFKATDPFIFFRAAGRKQKFEVADELKLTLVDMGMKMKDFAKHDVNLLKVELGSLKDKILSLIPALAELLNIFSGKRRKGFELDFDWERPDWVKDLFAPLPKYTDTATSEFTKKWKEATSAVAENFKTMLWGIERIQQDIVSGWEQAIGKMMQRGSSFADFMKDIYDVIYQSFVDFVSKMIAQNLLLMTMDEKARKKYETGHPGILSGWNVIEALTGWRPRTEEEKAQHGRYGTFMEKQEEKGGLYTPGFQMPPWEGAQKQAIEVKITNPPGIPLTGTARTESGGAGKQAVLGITLELAEEDATFREIFVNK